MLKEKTLLKSGIIKLLKNSKYSFLGLVDFFFWSGELSDFLFVIQCSKSAIYRQCSNKTGNVFFENIKQPLPVFMSINIRAKKSYFIFLQESGSHSSLTDFLWARTLKKGRLYNLLSEFIIINIISKRSNTRYLLNLYERENF